jgi:hypothetical protein
MGWKRGKECMIIMYDYNAEQEKARKISWARKLEPYPLGRRQSPRGGGGVSWEKNVQFRAGLWSQTELDLIFYPLLTCCVHSEQLRFSSLSLFEKSDSLDPRKFMFGGQKVKIQQFPMV